MRMASDDAAECAHEQKREDDGIVQPYRMKREPRWMVKKKLYVNTLPIDNEQRIEEAAGARSDEQGHDEVEHEHDGTGQPKGVDGQSDSRGDGDRRERMPKRQRLSGRKPLWLPDSRPYCAGKSFVGNERRPRPHARASISRLTRLSRSRERTDRPPVALPTTI